MPMINMIYIRIIKKSALSLSIKYWKMFNTFVLTNLRTHNYVKFRNLSWLRRGQDLRGWAESVPPPPGLENIQKSPPD